MTKDEEDSMSELYQSLSHSKWDCKYHVVFVPKRRRKAIFGQARRQLGAIFHALARQKGMPDYRGSSDAGSRAYVHRHSPQTPGGIGDRISQREECDRHRSPERQGAQLYGRAFLGSRLRSIDRRVRTGTGPNIHTRPGDGGWSNRTILNTNKARNARRLDP